MARISVFFVAAVIVILGIGFWWSSPNEETSTNGGLDGDSVGSPMVEVVLPVAFSENAQIGQRVFEAKCADCHGANAAGQQGVAPPLVHKIYEPSHHSDMAFVLAAKNGVRAHHWKFGNMPKIEGITEGEVKFVATYVRELQRGNGIN